MIKNTIQIDKEKCIGCGLCVNTCHEGAIALVDGKAKLVKKEHCDGLGRCLPVCPTDAISFQEVVDTAPLQVQAKEMPQAQNAQHAQTQQQEDATSQLQQWPVQIKLVPVNAPYFENADLLIAADCTAFSYANFHEMFMKDRITLIGCPKLDEGDYTEKLTAILQQNTIKSITVVRMEVPCCSGIANAATNALKNSGKRIPWQVVTISTKGELI